MDTITAIITPPGVGAIAAIRISGPKALMVADAIFSRDLTKAQSHRAYYGDICYFDKTILDSVLLLVMKAPNSYTGEDVVEIFTHGGTVIAPKILNYLVERGLRLAKPGEFTLRAYRNNKLDLAQAEAVQDLICADNDRALKIASQQLKGGLSTAITAIQNRLCKVIAELEVMLDFSTEHVASISLDRAFDEIAAISTILQRLAKTFDEGRKLFEGITVAIIGEPNSGKSSLMNALCNDDVAIVTPQAGTTRDILSQKISLAGFNIAIMDTAGIRKSADTVEKIGIDRAYKSMDSADIVLLLLDATKKDFPLLATTRSKNRIIVYNKIDLNPAFCPKEPDALTISVKEKLFLDLLKKRLLQTIKKPSFAKNEIFLTKLRHKKAVLKSSKLCKIVLNSRKEPLECLVETLKEALGELSSIIGKNITDDILDNIFSSFCIGK